MGDQFWHNNIIQVDLVHLQNHLENFNEFFDCFNTAILEAKKRPLRPGWELEHALNDWHEYKFFSVDKPKDNVKPDMRFICQYNWDYKNIYILAVGYRNAKETRTSDEEHSVYYIATERLERMTAQDWTEITEY